MSMILILPRKGDSISGTLKSLAGNSFGTVLKRLRESDELFGEEDLHVYLPRFHVHSDLTLNEILDNVRKISIYHTQCQCQLKVCVPNQ